MSCRFKGRHPCRPTVQPIGWYSLQCRLSLELERVSAFPHLLVPHLFCTSRGWRSPFLVCVRNYSSLPTIMVSLERVWPFTKNSLKYSHSFSPNFFLLF